MQFAGESKSFTADDIAVSGDLQWVISMYRGDSIQRSRV